MRLEQREKELDAIGASIGANCRPCIEHHLAAGRDAGLSETELADAVATAQAIRHQATVLFSARVDELLLRREGDAPEPGVRREGDAPEPGPVPDRSRSHELVALGASIGSNSHPLLDLHIATALETGLSPAEVEAALKMAEYVQKRAAEMTAEKAIHVLEGQGGASANTAAGNRHGDPTGGAT